MNKKLTADLNVLSNSGLEIELLNGDLNIIQKLDDEPNDVGGLTSAQLKAKFDESGNIIKEYINETLIPAVLADDATEAARQEAEQGRVTAEQRRVSAEEARETAEEARVSAETARNGAEGTRILREQGRITAEAARESAEEAREAAEQARADENTGIVVRATALALAADSSASAAAASATSANVASKTAESWAVGGTGTRTGEDTNNAKYWAEHAAEIAGGDYASPAEVAAAVATHNGSGDAHGALFAAKQDKITASGILKGDGAGGVTPAGTLAGQAGGQITPGAHASQHASGGSDPVTPESIGAAPALTGSDRVIHVAKTGSDTTGDGSEARAYLTIQKAVDSLPRLLLNRVIIRVHQGTYDEAVTLDRRIAADNLVLQGASGESVKVKTVYGLAVTGCLGVENLELTGTSGSGYNWSLHCAKCSYVSIENVKCTGTVDTASFGAIRINHCGVVAIKNTEISNKPIALDVLVGQVYLNNTVTGTGNTVAIRCGSAWGNLGGYVQKGGATIAGEEQKGYGGQIW